MNNYYRKIVLESQNVQLLKKNVLGSQIIQLLKKKYFRKSECLVIKIMFQEGRMFYYSASCLCTNLIS